MASGPHERKSGGYEVRWREGSRNRSKTFKPVDETKAADRRAYERALVFKQETEEAAEQNRPVVTRKDSPTLREFALESLGQRDIEDRTLRLYLRWLKKHVFPHVGHLPLLDCTPIRMDEWKRERVKQGAGRATIGKTMTLLGSIFKRAVRLQLIPANPMEGAEKPGYTKRDRRWLTAEQVELIRNWYLDRGDVGSATLVSVLGYVGIRPEAALALRVEDVGRKLTVRARNVGGQILPGSKTNPNRKRAHYLPEPVRVDLDNWISLQKLKPGKLLFSRPDGEPWTENDYVNWCRRHPRKLADGSKVMDKCFKLAISECGLTGTTPYSLRHTAASLYLAAGWTAAEVAHQLDHSVAVSTREYQHLIEEYQGVKRRSVDEWILKARGLNPVRQVFAEETLT